MCPRVWEFGHDGFSEARKAAGRQAEPAPPQQVQGSSSGSSMACSFLSFRSLQKCHLLKQPPSWCVS